MLLKIFCNNSNNYFTDYLVTNQTRASLTDNSSGLYATKVTSRNSQESPLLGSVSTATSTFATTILDNISSSGADLNAKRTVNTAVSQKLIETSLMHSQPPGTIIKCVTAQAIQTTVGPRIVLQGLQGTDLTPQQLSIVHQQVKQQLLKAQTNMGKEASLKPTKIYLAVQPFVSKEPSQKSVVAPSYCLTNEACKYRPLIYIIIDINYIFNEKQ